MPPRKKASAAAKEESVQTGTTGTALAPIISGRPPVCELWRPYLFPPRSRPTLPPPDGSKAFQQRDFDFQYQRSLHTQAKPVKDVGDFGDLARLLDGANLIYCLNHHQLFGLLRAHAGDIIDLNSYNWAPCADIHNPYLPNPLRPKEGDPYLAFMNAERPFPSPTRDQVEGITKPTLLIPPDPSWKPIHMTKKEKKEEESEAGVQEFSQGSGASEYNADDTKDDIEQYLNSKRWMGSEKVNKKDPPYFRDSQMIHWVFKTLSLCGDLKMDDLTIQDLRHGNQHVPWWDSPAVHPARKHHQSDLDEHLGNQAWYTTQHMQNKTDLIRLTLEREVRFVADMLTILHHHQLPLTCHVKRWNRTLKRYQMRWELLSVKVSTPALSNLSSRVIPDPTNSSSSSSKGGSAKTPRKGTKAAARPKPDAPEPQLPAVVPDTYNVVCAIAVANFKRFYNEGEWCELMYMNAQLISAVACLVIDRHHPQGTLKIYYPQTSTPTTPSPTVKLCHPTSSQPTTPSPTVKQETGTSAVKSATGTSHS